MIQEVFIQNVKDKNSSAIWNWGNYVSEDFRAAVTKLVDSDKSTMKVLKNEVKMIDAKIWMLFSKSQQLPLIATSL
jgi:hypothetical protein